MKCMASNAAGGRKDAHAHAPTLCTAITMHIRLPVCRSGSKSWPSSFSSAIPHHIHIYSFAFSSKVPICSRGLYFLSTLSL
jgi:hypothetical protein